MKMALIDFKAYLRINPPCPAFWGVAPRNMKIIFGTARQPAAD
jgi:hypothetical protein